MVAGGGSAAEIARGRVVSRVKAFQNDCFFFNGAEVGSQEDYMRVLRNSKSGEVDVQVTEEVREHIRVRSQGFIRGMRRLEPGWERMADAIMR